MISNHFDPDAFIDGIHTGKIKSEQVLCKI